eukprot:m.312755 g.312755  ORF g.312755 m.312755 type:complete len:78 (-) comp20243_c0_seq25:667-900(-)
MESTARMSLFVRLGSTILHDQNVDAVNSAHGPLPLVPTHVRVNHHTNTLSPNIGGGGAVAASVGCSELGARNFTARA